MATHSSRRSGAFGLFQSELRLESLEARTLLAADLGAVDFSALEVEAGAYDDASILVRFTQDGLAGEDGAADVAQNILAGSESASLLSSLPDLQRIALPQGTTVEQALELFRASALVMYAEPNYQLTVSATPNDPQFGQLWGLENDGQTLGTIDADIDAAGAWDVNTGSGSMIVAVIDTGIDYNHPDLATNIWVNAGEIAGDGIDNDGNGYIDDVHGYDFFNGDGDPFDDNGHGTHVAGTIGAVGDNALGVTGINWNIQIMALKFLGANGSGTSSDAIEAINYAVSNGAKISNNSWGGDPPSQAMFDAIAAANFAGHIFVAAAGNGNALGIGIDNDAQPFFPSSYELDNIVSVAAVDHNDQLATFSNYGATSVNLAAPGVNILSTLPGGYGASSGTSMAAPHVAGVLALVWDAHPEWSYNQVIAQVLSTVDPLPQLAGVVATGGRLNAAAALGNPQPLPPPPPPGTLPILDDFQDNQAEFFDAQSGNWNASGGRFNVTPAFDNDNLPSISTLRLDAPLPDDFEFRATLNADEGHVEIFGIVISDRLTNAFVIFDYQAPDDFKFAGADMDQDRWVVGHRNASGWTTDAWFGQTLNAQTDYQVRLVVQDGNEVTLDAGGAAVVTHTFAESVVDGDAGLGTQNSSSHFDNVLVRAYTEPVPTTLPYAENFDDGLAENLLERSGLSSVAGGRLEISTLSGGDGISTLLLSEPLPASLDVRVTFNADDASGSLFSNGMIIFDYLSPTDFKFAGAYVGGNQWLLGHRDASGWVTDVSASAVINPLTDYDLQLVIEGDTATLYADGVQRVVRQYTGSLTDGQVGLGTRNATARFDDFSVAAPPAGGELPFAEDFNDGVADLFDVRVGTWATTAGEYAATPVSGGDTVSTIQLDSLPDEWEMSATINMDGASGGLLSNGFLIFDYHSPTNFKFAGAYAGSDQWLIGHRNQNGWVTDAIVNAGAIDPLVDYQLTAAIESDGTVTLSVDGVERVTFQFTDSLTDGEIGVGTRNAKARFDDVTVVQTGLPPGPVPTTLPMSESFDDGLADNFLVVAGLGTIVGDDYQLAPPVGVDAVSTLLVSGPLPSALELQTTINMDAGSGGLLSNGFLIFDYQSPTDFKFAGAYAGSDQWLIGHRDASGWVTDAVMSGVIDPLTDYQLRMVIESDGQVTLFENGLERVSHQFAGSLVDGAVGLATREAVTRFDNFSASEYVPPPPPPSADLPYQEDFDDGVADFLSVRSGTWNVTGGSYQVTPTVNEDGISTLQLSALPSELQLSAVVNMNDAGGGYFSNAFLIFDYQSPTDFKFAGAYAGSNQWLIGHRTAAGWTTDAVTVGTIDPLTDYTLSVSIQQDGAVMLFADGVERISHQFAGSLTDGDVGLGVRNAVSRFDNFTVEQFAPPPPPPGATLPHQEDFEDGVADYFEVHSGAWSVEDGELQVTPAAGADGISLLELDEPPTDLEISATINMDAASGGFFSNAFIIFDFKSATDFKFAGAYAGSDQWVIGHRTAGGWNTDAVATGPIDPLTDYDLRLVITSSGQATLHVDGVARVSRTYSEQLTDGGIGLGTRNAVSRFDNLLVTPVGGMQSEDPTDPGDGSRWCKAIDKLFALRERQERKGRSARPHDFEQAISVLAALQDKKLAKFTAKKANRHDLVLARYEKSSHELFDDVCTPAAKSLQALPKSHTKVEAAGRGRC